MLQKTILNSLMLTLIIGIVILPSVSSGIMKVNVDDRVLSVQDERLTVPEKPKKLPSNIKIETIIIQERKPVEVVQESSDSLVNESTDSLEVR